MTPAPSLLFALVLVASGLILGLRTLQGRPRLLESLGDQGFDELLGPDVGRGLELLLCSLLVLTGLLVALGVLPPDA
jgi:hypothetical protein